MSMQDFLLEIRCEEIPARMQAGARAELETLFRRELGAAGVSLGEVSVWSTPRRLALIAKGLPEATEAVSEEFKGPPEGAPDAAIEGFCRKLGIGREALEIRDVKGRGTYFAVVEKAGQDMKAVLSAAISAILRDFSWPKSQRWGAASIAPESMRWVRPLSGIVALLGEELVECEVGGIASSNTTMGHRFHSSGEITITSAADYAEKLHAAHVIVGHEERAAIIREGAAKAATDAGLRLVEDEGLVVENAGLTEWPVPLLGRFDEAFLEVPPEVIQLTARVNQKYFVCEDAAGKLANAFICTANVMADDNGAAIIDGNRKVLAARLSDARFFWEQDLKTPLAEHAKKLARITFHEKLGTVADKAERVAKLARWLCEEGIVKGDPALAEQAARLCKADLVTEMVGEFPELQGLMGGYYAAKEGLDPQVSDAIRDHYKPVGQGDDVPSAPVTVAVSLADKLDTLFQFFMAEMSPTGSKDPFALRRAALAILALICSNSLRFDLSKLIEKSYRDLIKNWRSNGDFACFSNGKEPYIEDGHEGWVIVQNPIYEDSDLEDYPEYKKLLLIELYEYDDTRELYDVYIGDTRVLEFSRFAEYKNNVLEFLADRLKVQQKEAGVRHDLIDAVFALGGEDDLVRLLARVHALQAFIVTEDGANLLAGYKRAANILKKEEWDEAAASAAYEKEPAEVALLAALDGAEPRAAKAIEAEDFAGAMAALATLRAPIDAFFNDVTVNDADPAKRAARLNLLSRMTAMVQGVADFSRIEG